MPILDIQRRSQQIGRIRIGHQVKTSNGGSRPERLTAFRFTTPSKGTAESIAGLYGGTVQPWEGQYEVVTGQSEIAVTVPPRDAVISQWYELWTKGGCQRRCDSQREQISGGECQCPHASDPSDPDEVRAMALERDRLAKQGKACSRVTRINVMIPDLPGLGVFRLDTGSFYAAQETGDKADVMELARERDIYLPATLSIEWRKRIANGKTTPYPVPVLQILNTVREITGGTLQSGIAGALAVAPREVQRAITAGTPAPAPREDRPAAAARQQRPPTAQEIANAAAKATTRAQVVDMKAQAERLEVEKEMINPPGSSDLYEELDSYLHGRWEELPAAGAA